MAAPPAGGRSTSAGDAGAVAAVAAAPSPAPWGSAPAAGGSGTPANPPECGVSSTGVATMGAAPQQQNEAAAEEPVQTSDTAAVSQPMLSDSSRCPAGTCVCRGCYYCPTQHDKNLWQAVPSTDQMPLLKTAQQCIGTWSRSCRPRALWWRQQCSSGCKCCRCAIRLLGKSGRAAQSRSQTGGGSLQMPWRLSGKQMRLFSNRDTTTAPLLHPAALQQRTLTRGVGCQSELM